MFNIQEELKKLPEKPGVYIMKDEDGNIIYIGKAVKLKNRVRQYFQSSKNHTPKVRAMVSKIREFEYIITDSELEALILECNLIKKHRPKYNILLKDDKHYPYIKVTMNEEYPRILITRKVEKDGGKYFGPYSSSFYVNETIDLIKRIFPVRTCKKEFPRDIAKERPCLNFFIKRCLAPCQGDINKEDYRNMMKDICLFLDGKQNELLQKLENDMLEYSKQLNFEKAAQLRDKINSLTHIAQRQKVISTAMEDQDVIAFAENEENKVVQVFFIRGGKLIGRENFALDGVEDSSRKEILYEFMKRFYSSTEYVPREVLLQEEIDEFNIVENWLSSKKGAKVHLRVPKKGEKHQLVDMVYKNAVQALDSFNKPSSSSVFSALNQLMELLKFTKIPARMEAYDISNIQGSLSVGVMIVYTNGMPDKSQYRRFKIKTVQGSNDYLSMQEVIFRRFTNKERFPESPDLILVDGGKGHITSVQEILSSLSLNVPVCGMVKDDKHKTRGIIYGDNEINLSNIPAVFKLITEIQNEVHRFAIEYHRKLRDKQLKKSVLDDIIGIGEIRKKALLKYFKNIENIKNASIEELAKVKSMNKRAAEIVYRFFNK